MLWRHEKLACRLASEFGVGRRVLELIFLSWGMGWVLGIHDIQVMCGRRRRM